MSRRRGRVRVAAGTGPRHADQGVRKPAPPARGRANLLRACLDASSSPLRGRWRSDGARDEYRRLRRAVVVDASQCNGLARDLAARPCRAARLRRDHQGGAVLNSAAMRPGAAVAVIGTGEVGLNAIRARRSAEPHGSSCWTRAGQARSGTGFRGHRWRAGGPKAAAAVGR